MALAIDLHSHSTASDGSLTPTELVERAAAQGVKTLALTDHDTVAGIAEARRAAERCDLSLLPGVEISVTWGKTAVHVVGLGIDIEHSGLLAGLRGLQEHRVWRAREIARKLDAVGIPDCYAGAEALAEGLLISRTHFAQHLVASGRAKSLQAAFKRFLARGKPAYVAGEWADLAEAVAWIRAADGSAVIAHPARYQLTKVKLEQLAQAFKAAGGEGLEIISGSHGVDDVFHMSRLALKVGLKGSVGSDFHGISHGGQLGIRSDLPPEVEPIWSDWAVAV